MEMTNKEQLVSLKGIFSMICTTFSISTERSETKCPTFKTILNFCVNFTEIFRK